MECIRFLALQARPAFSRCRKTRASKGVPGKKGSEGCRRLTFVSIGIRLSRPCGLGTRGGRLGDRLLLASLARQADWSLSRTSRNSPSQPTADTSRLNIIRSKIPNCKLQCCWLFAFASPARLFVRLLPFKEMGRVRCFNRLSIIDLWYSYRTKMLLLRGAQECPWINILWFSRLAERLCNVRSFDFHNASQSFRLKI